jgi:hypothetical protein
MLLPKLPTLYRLRGSPSWYYHNIPTPTKLTLSYTPVVTRMLSDSIVILTHYVQAVALPSDESMYLLPYENQSMHSLTRANQCTLLPERINALPYRSGLVPEWIIQARSRSQHAFSATDLESRNSYDRSKPLPWNAAPTLESNPPRRTQT